ncbi:MAG: 23S rRNA (pseudouridine(1915)-N(3))-methyltransferase RlmH [Woeseiaceae bacterium]
MHIRLVAVGDRQPSWVDDAFAAYIGRYPREWKFQLDNIATAKRTKADRSGKARDAEGDLLMAKVADDEQLVLLDEHGKQLSSKTLATRLSDWQLDGRNICFIIGGPDGVSSAVKQRANFTWSLSALTLPHGLARVLFAEQLYRAWSLQTGHPYHRA